MKRDSLVTLCVMGLMLFCTLQLSATPISAEELLRPRPYNEVPGAALGRALDEMMPQKSEFELRQEAEQAEAARQAMRDEAERKKAIASLTTLIVLTVVIVVVFWKRVTDVAEILWDHTAGWRHSFANFFTKTYTRRLILGVTVLWLLFANATCWIFRWSQRYEVSTSDWLFHLLPPLFFAVGVLVWQWVNSGRR